MKALTFCIRLLEPVLVSQAQSGEENSAVGLSFIPGSTLRGALVRRYLHHHPSADLASDPQGRRLFFDGAVCYLNAYPWREGRRMLPRPISWFTEKDRANDEQAKTYDWAVDREQLLDQPKPPVGAFCHITDKQLALYTPSRHISVHISLEDPNRRDERNVVYRYDALAEGELFGAAIVAEDETDLRTLQHLLVPDEMWIGGARTAGYGRVRIENPAVNLHWEEYPPGDDPDDGRVIVTLLSDAILRGEGGQVDGNLEQALADELQVHEVECEARFQRLRLVGGFNRKWGLPLVQTWALQAGSVYVCPAGAVEPAALRQATARGIGERCTEGFGRMAVNWHTQPSLQRRPITPESLPAPPPLSDDSKELAERMTGRQLRLLLERKLAEAVNDAILSAYLPQNAQLSRVRNAAQEALAKRDLTVIVEHLHNLKRAREQFERARVRTTPMYQWIEDRASQLDVEAQLLRSEPLPQVAGESAVLTDGLRMEYAARLIDGVMKKAIKKNQDQEEAR